MPRPMAYRYRPASDDLFTFHVAVGAFRPCKNRATASRLIAESDFINGDYDIHWLEHYMAGEK